VNFIRGIPKVVEADDSELRGINLNYPPFGEVMRLHCAPAHSRLFHTSSRLPKRDTAVISTPFEQYHVLRNDVYGIDSSIQW